LGSNRLFVLNRLPWPLRLPVKWLLFGLTYFVVCFPFPARFVRHVQHWRNPHALVEPHAPELEPLVAKLQMKLGPDLSESQVLKHVESFVYSHVPYAWDWDTWGMADYLPTVAEVIQMGREDCDGRAVIAASLLTRVGIPATLVTDFEHAWVKTKAGEVMAMPRPKPIAVVADETGVHYNFRALAYLPDALAFGISVFPLVRELMIVASLWLLLLRPNGGAACNLVSMSLLVGGLIALRAGQTTGLWLQLLGVTAILAGVALTLTWARSNARRSASAAGPAAPIQSHGRNM